MPKKDALPIPFVTKRDLQLAIKKLRRYRSKESAELYAATEEARRQKNEFYEKNEEYLRLKAAENKLEGEYNNLSLREKTPSGTRTSSMWT